MIISLIVAKFQVDKIFHIFEKISVRQTRKFVFCYRHQSCMSGQLIFRSTEKIISLIKINSTEQDFSGIITSIQIRIFSYQKRNVFLHIQSLFKSFAWCRLITLRRKSLPSVANIATPHDNEHRKYFWVFSFFFFSIFKRTLSF